MPTKGFLRAYVDETGDRGMSASSSQFFAMSGVVVANEDEPVMRTAVRAIRAELKVPATKPLHWQEHVKTFSRRQFVTAELARLPLISNFVTFEKAAIPQNAALRRDHVVFYNYAAKLMLERLLLTARDWPDGPRPLIATFGHVRGFDHGNTLAYLRNAANRQHQRQPHWQLLHGLVKWAGAGDYDGLQVADQYAGMLSAALCKDKHGGYEPYRGARASRSWPSPAPCRPIRGGRPAGFKKEAPPGGPEAPQPNSAGRGWQQPWRNPRGLPEEPHFTSPDRG